MQSTITGSKEEIRSIVQDTKVVIWSKTYCPYCRQAKELIESLKRQNDKLKSLDYRFIELDTLEFGAQIQNNLYDLTGQKTVPSVWIGGKFIGGNSDTQDLHRRGKLVPLLEE
eukprot:TRINITY_DN12501_c0_g1_i1.p1 TRINITY_DN12501_c0_g1~~TRINITY_DN12501_c0_g1_i1.p1  ORF type:complete len:113 (-),score=19.34 TRINITY_DN12501_c0_g1_i1:46-384(-)